MDVSHKRMVTSRFVRKSPLERDCGQRSGCCLPHTNGRQRSTSLKCSARPTAGKKGELAGYIQEQLAVGRKPSTTGIKYRSISTSPSIDTAFCGDPIRWRSISTVKESFRNPRRPPITSRCISSSILLLEASGQSFPTHPPY